MTTTVNTATAPAPAVPASATSWLVRALESACTGDRDEVLAAVVRAAMGEVRRGADIRALATEAYRVAPRLGRALHAIRRLREERAARRSVSDPLAARQPGHYRRRAIQRRLRAALRVAGLRTTRHGHDTVVHVVAAGEEGATSTTLYASPQSLGLPRAYARVAYRVACSLHEWRVSERLLAAPPSERGFVYLAPDVRVRNGRGTSLVVERLRQTERGARWTA